MKRMYKTTLDNVGQILSDYKSGCSDHYVPLELLKFEARVDNIGLNSDSLRVGSNEFGFKQLGERQMCRFIGVNGGFFSKCNAKNRQGIFDQFISDTLEEDPTKEIFVRTHNNMVRGALSDNYGTFDDLRLFDMIRNILGDKSKDIEVRSFCKDDDSGHTDIQLLWKNDEISIGKNDKGGNDIVRRGFNVGNSELGIGSVRIEPMLYRLVCTNGLIRTVASQSSMMRHLGKQEKLEKKIGAMIWNMDQLHQEMISHLVDAKEQKIVRMKVEKFIRDTAAGFNINNDKATLIVDAWHQEEGDTKFHVANAFTRAAHQSFDGQESYDLEVLGNTILDTDIEEMIRNIERADAAKIRNKKESADMKSWAIQYTNA
jgi:hypothetical protein